MQRRIIVILLLFSWIVPVRLAAHPVSYKNALSIMTWNQPYLNDIWTTYSYRRDAAVAARYMRMEMEDGAEMKVYLPQADFLLFRRNGPASQANLYVYGGYGGENMNGKTGGAGILGIEADAEDRRWYGSVAFQSLLPTIGPTIYQTIARAGVAAYESEFNELGTWLILQYQSNPQLALRQDWTPMVRFMYRNALLELGSSISGKALLNFMVHF